MLTQKNGDEKKIYHLPNLTSKHSSNLVARIVSITFGILGVLFLVTLAVISIVKINITIEASGYLEPVIVNTVYSPISGRIEEVFVKEGQIIKKGDSLLKYDKFQLEGNISKAISDLEIKKINYSIREKTIPIELEQSNLQIKKAEAQLLKAKAGLRQKLVDYFPGVNADSFLVNYKKGTHISLDYASAEITTAEAELQSLKSKQNMQEINSMQLKATLLEIEQLERNIKLAQMLLNKSDFATEYDGIILTENLERLRSSVVNEGTKLFEIARMDNWKAVLIVNEGDAYELKIGDPVRIEVKAMRLSEEYIFLTGKISSISSEPLSLNGSSANSTKAYKVEVAIQMNPNEKYFNQLRRGYTLDAKIIKENDRIISLLIKNLKKLL
ncbi:MAG: HlyD family efflux transporter periplasmic adaptor subunit [Ignavibacteriales bacterium]|nr:HlyD family efflux transporter periplasmic adaptor subunit [Ignavibacteriales bacterium]